MTEHEILRYIKVNDGQISIEQLRIDADNNACINELLTNIRITIVDHMVVMSTAGFIRLNTLNYIKECNRDKDLSKCR